LEQIDKIDFSRNISLYSQTTKSLEGFSEIIAEIKRRVKPGVKFEYSDTICRQVANRVEHLREFAAAHDVVLFVAGEKSSNGKILFSHCREVNENAHLVANPDMIDAAWLKNAHTIGICGATSTPRWLMEQVANKANEICN
jgi:4-hydroxy-3-methylbut-2-enyl diphosphate reductase